MTECFVYIAVYDRYEGVIIDDVIYFRNEEKELLTMMDMEMYLYHGNMEPVKFSVDGKWGLVDIITGKIIIDPITWMELKRKQSEFCHILVIKGKMPVQSRQQ